MLNFPKNRPTISTLLSGEFFLKGGRRANGGGMVILRSLWVTAYLTAIALLLKNISDEGRDWSFSLGHVIGDLRELSGWIVAAFGGIYLAFYSRFSAQWAYLANMYNQIKQAEVTRSDITNSSKPLAQWKAGFIEDALDLHLASKPSIAGIISAWSSEQDIKDAFIAYTPAGVERWNHVQAISKAAIDATKAQWDTSP